MLQRYGAGDLAGIAGAIHALIGLGCMLYETGSLSLCG